MSVDLCSDQWTGAVYAASAFGLASDKITTIAGKGQFVIRAVSICVLLCPTELPQIGNTQQPDALCRFIHCAHQCGYELTNREQA